MFRGDTSEAPDRSQYDPIPDRAGFGSSDEDAVPSRNPFTPPSIVSSHLVNGAIDDSSSISSSYQSPLVSVVTKPHIPLLTDVKHQSQTRHGSNALVGVKVELPRPPPIEVKLPQAIDRRNTLFWTPEKKIVTGLLAGVSALLAYYHPGSDDSIYLSIITPVLGLTALCCCCFGCFPEREDDRIRQEAADRERLGSLYRKN